MKKKILTYMMAAMVIFGCAGVSSSITAYAGEGGDVTWYTKADDTWHTDHYEPTTPEQEAARKAQRWREFGLSEAEIQERLQQMGYGTAEVTVNTSTLSETSTSAPAEADAVSEAPSQAAPKKPTYTQEQIDAAWEETERAESTCVVAGSVVYKNSLTGATKTEELPLVDHDYQETANVAATCTEDGHITTTCSVCGDEQTKTVKATGHQAGASVVAKQAGLFSEGESTVSCTECGELLSFEVLPQTCPLPLAAVIGIAVAVVAAIGGVVFAVVRKKKAAVAE